MDLTFLRNLQPLPVLEAAEVHDFMHRDAGRPVLIRGLTAGWPGMTLWTVDLFRRRCGGLEVRVDRGFGGEHRTMTIAAYLDYLKSATEQDPFYLMNWAYSLTHPEFLAEYRMPDYFRSWHRDLPPEEAEIWNWFFIGPAGSGAVLHRDVCLSSAWNALISGRKFWIFFPPDCREVATHEKKNIFEILAANPVLMTRVLEKGYYCEQIAGDVLYTPGYYRHAVWNLENAISVTENFINATNAHLIKRYLPGSGQTRERLYWLRRHFPMLLSG